MAVALLAATAPGAVEVSFSNPAGAQSTTAGSVTGFGDVTSYGAPPGDQLNAPVNGITSTPDGKGYWLLGADGGVFSYGDAQFYGSLPGDHITTEPVVGMAATPDGKGYWIASSGGLVWNFGDAPEEDELGVELQAPVVGIASVPDGVGYWLVGADGGMFSFGDAGFYGSLPGDHVMPNQPVVGMAATPDGDGYWLVAADGGVFSFGDAGFFGSLPGDHITPNQPVVGMAATPDGKGYWLVAADGGVFSFGEASFYGSMGASPPPSSTPVAAMAATSDGEGYWLTTTDKALPAPTPVPSVLYEGCDPTAPAAVEPSSIVLGFCASDPPDFDNLAWSSWKTTTATATGYYTYDTCNPNCAQGTYVSAPSSVRLSYPIETSAGKEFSTISYTYASSSGSGSYVQLLETSPGRAMVNEPDTTCGGCQLALGRRVGSSPEISPRYSLSGRSVTQSGRDEPTFRVRCRLSLPTTTARRRIARPPKFRIPVLRS